MELTWVIQQLATHSVAIIQLCKGLSDEDVHAKPDEESSSLLEVITHLYEEERQDFRYLLDMTMKAEATEWPLVAIADELNDNIFQRTLAQFAAERQRSIEWLQSLEGLDLNRSYTHPKGATLSAGEILGSWVAHDVLHMRQLVELHFYLTKLRSEPYSIDYAGEW